MYSALFYRCLIIGVGVLSIGIPTAIPWIMLAKNRHSQNENADGESVPTITLDRIRKLYPINPVAWQLYPTYVRYNTRTGDEANAKPEEVVTMQLSRRDLKNYKKWLKELEIERDVTASQASSTAKRKILLEQWGKDLNAAAKKGDRYVI